MKLIDMKLPKKSKKEMEGEMPAPVPMDQPEYPYGLTLRFDKEQVEKLSSLDNIESGETVYIQARGYVKAVMTEDMHGKGRVRNQVEIQLQKIGISTDNAEESFAEDE